MADIVFTGDSSQLEASANQAQAAINKVSDSTEKLEKKTKKAAGQTKDFGQNIQKLRGALSSASPALGNLAGMANDAGDAMEVMTAAGPVLSTALAAVAQAAVVGYVAWRVYSDEGVKADKINKILGDGFTALGPILLSTRDATLALKVATGELSEEQGKLLTNSQRAFDALQKSTEATRKAVHDLSAEQASVGTQIVDMAESWIPAWTPLGVVLRSVTTDSKDLRDQIDANNQVILEGIKLTKENVKVTGDVIKTDERSAKAKEALKKAEDEVAEAKRKEAEAAKEAAAAQKKADEDAFAFWQDLEAHGAEIKKESADLAKKLSEEEADRAIELAKLKEELQRQEIEGAKSAATGIADLSSTVAEAIGKNHKKSALALFYVSKAAAVAEVAVASIQNVAESAKIGYPQNIPGIAAAVIQGAASTAAIVAAKPPSFHTGTSRVDEMNATLQKGEAVTTSQAADRLGRNNIDRANRGMNVGQDRRERPAIIQYRHKEYNEFIRDNLRIGGPLANKFAAGKTVGHRENRG